MDALEAYETVPEAFYLGRHLARNGHSIQVALAQELGRFKRLAEITEEVRDVANRGRRVALMAERRQLISEIAASSGVEEGILLGIRS